MGCMQSAEGGRLTRSKGGSMIFAKRKQREMTESYTTDDIFSSSENTYKMGDRILRPVEIRESFKVVVPPSPTASKETEPLYTTCGYKSLRGRSAAPPHKPNQDSLAVFQLKDRPHATMFSVFDGHGPFGEYASHYCRMQMHESLVAAAEKTSDIKAAASEAIEEVHQNFCAVSPTTGVDPLVSGTTLISVLFDGSTMHCANVGDSRAILCQKPKNGNAKVVELSDDHKPAREDEQARIKKSNAVLMTEGDVRGLSDTSSNEKLYVCRQKNGDIIYGVLFTRSLGDKDAHNHLGVSQIPEYTERHIDPSVDKYVVLASDGIWDHMSNEEVMDICFIKEDALLACEEIVRIAAARWESDSDNRRDDITVLVVRIDDKEQREKDKNEKNEDPVATEVLDVHIDENGEITKTMRPAGE